MPDMDRDQILQLDDVALSAKCEIDFFRATGPGGQKRNKSSSAVRLKLTGTAFAVTDCTERSQHQNRANALRKMRMLVALNCRCEVAPDPALPSACAKKNPAYPLWCARIFDVLAAENWELAPAAAKLGWTTTALLKVLSGDPELWRNFCDIRKKNGLPALHPAK